ncbi:Uncharacterised protein [Salmonella enterica subsp. arizonae]|nr:Uncharacterised protein [Salmonella enterica subsp. arizonae]
MTACINKAEHLEARKEIMQWLAITHNFCKFKGTYWLQLME